MAITERHAILMDLPIVFRQDALAQGKWGVAFDRDMPSRYAVVPRSGGDVRFFEAESAYVYHSVNAWEEGDEIVMIGCRVDDPIPAVNPADGPWARANANLRVRAKLCEWRFDLATGRTRERVLDDRNTDFPSVDRSRVGRKTRYAWNMSLDVETTVRFDGIVKYDLETGRSDVLAFGEGRSGSEASFAPRTGRVAEDDGYLLSFVHDAREQRSELWIVDAREVSRGPVARLLVPHRVPLGFHATWVTGKALGRAS
jgi:carotenoid cleavage dioxygenase